MQKQSKENNTDQIGNMGYLDYSDELHSENKRLLTSVTHISGLFSWIIGPLIIYLITDDEFVKENASEAFSWQLNLTIYLGFSITMFFIGLGLPLIIMLTTINIWFCIMASLRSIAGKSWEYPFSKNYLSD